MTIDWGSYRAVLFDLDGVLTPTAEVHRRAWKRTFDEFLRAEHPGEREFTDDDYFQHVDGKPRYDGVRDFLLSRDIRLPDGDPKDPPGWSTVCAIGNAKNESFNVVLEEDGVDAYPGSLRLLDHLEALAVKMAVVSSSANAPKVLAAAGLTARFPIVVDGTVARSLGLTGKPAPDTFLEAASQVGSPIAATVVVEDAISGVQAGRNGDFGLVVGVARDIEPESLSEAGADIVVRDLGDSVPPSDPGTP